MYSVTTRYDNWHKIGEGATAVVYRVQDLLLRKNVAIKLLKEHCEQRIEFLTKETNVAHMLKHPNFCTVHDLYINERAGPGKRYGIVMDFVEGIDLKRWLQENCQRRADTMEARKAIFGALACSLGEVHAVNARFIHRDMKPANIFLRQGNANDPVIMDFGISLGYDDQETYPAGTPAYMAAEQVEMPDDIDQRCDLYALGVIGYQLFTDKLPPGQVGLETKEAKKKFCINRAAKDDLRPPSEYYAGLPKELDYLLMAMLAYDRDSRPTSVAEVYAFYRQVQWPPPSARYKRAAAIFSIEAIPAVEIPSGSFEIGIRPMMEGGLEQKPCRRVVISPFCMTVRPILNGEYKIFLEQTGHRHPPLLNDSCFGADDQPVVMVSWEDAAAFADYVGGSLPTEAQWEYAARYGWFDQVTPHYPWGPEEPSVLRANIFQTRDSPLPPGQCLLGANKLGIHDLIGNVREWCRDDWNPAYYKTLRDGAQDPVSIVQGAVDIDTRHKSLRGGGFDSLSKSQARPTHRAHAAVDALEQSIGFRLVFPADYVRNQKSSFFSGQLQTASDSFGTVDERNQYSIWRRK